MTAPNIPLAKLEAVNDAIAEGIDVAGSKSELFLVKVAMFLGAHYVSEDELKGAIEKSLNNLGGVLIILLTLPLFLIHFKKIAGRRTAWHVQT